jgi:hypothetical protein
LVRYSVPISTKSSLKSDLPIVEHTFDEDE